MSDSGEVSDTVSREAHQRIVTERDNLKSQVEQQTKQLQALVLVNDAYKFLKAQEGVPGDPYALATAAANDVTVRSSDPERLSDTLTTWLETQRNLFSPPPQAQAESASTEKQVPAPEARPPIPAPYAPSPASAGSPVSTGPLSYTQWRQKNPAATLEDYQRARSGNEVALSPER